jgi:aldehyde dehydrogenase (NAD(P)+)
MREKDPVLKKTITSELGNVSPVAIVPAEYSDAELWFQARNVATMVANNGSFNCNAGKMLITGKGWAQRDKFMALIGKALAQAPTRKAYYPGARDRYEDLLRGRVSEKFGEATDEKLAWAFIHDVDSSQSDERLFKTEPFCGILSETTVGSSDAAQFLAEVTTFCNDRLWGTLNATLVVHPRSEADPAVARALDKAIVDLRYGTVAINHWPALGYGFVTTPWGGHPSATLENIQSGLGWVHNTFMIEGIEKAVIRGPLVASPKPAWFFDNKKTHVLGAKLVDFEASPSWFKVPGMAIAALSG